GVPSLYRIHEKPDPKRVYEFESIAAAFGYSLGVGALPVQRFQFKTDRRASYGTGKRPREMELPKEVHLTPRMYQKLTQKIAGNAVVKATGASFSRESSAQARAGVLGRCRSHSRADPPGSSARNC